MKKKSLCIRQVNFTRNTEPLKLEFTHWEETIQQGPICIIASRSPINKLIVSVSLPSMRQPRELLSLNLVLSQDLLISISKKITLIKSNYKAKSLQLIQADNSRLTLPSIIKIFGKRRSLLIKLTGRSCAKMFKRLISTRLCQTQSI